ncbi:MAG: Uma2 family endonuclease [Pirellulales bacterium]|nr:Uma2 family endonuclease [Pirellulales bacterium]
MFNVWSTRSRAHVPPGYYVRQEQPLPFAASGPEPDVAVVRGVQDDHRRRRPRFAALVIEVSVPSEAVDREKCLATSRLTSEECWLVLPQFHTAELYTRPSEGFFLQKAILRGADSLSPAYVPTVKLARFARIRAMTPRSLPW